MPADVNCIFTKVLIPFLEREVGLGARGTAEICRVAGRPREYLMADHNWLPLPLADELIRTGMKLAGEPDEEAFIRRMGEFGMDWKPREERSYLGAYSMGIGDPRALYQCVDTLMRQIIRCQRFEPVEVGRRHARYRLTPVDGARIPRWLCQHTSVQLERFPTNWGLPRARVTEPECAALGAPACVLDVSWRNPSLGRVFWLATATGAAGTAALALTVAAPLPAGVDAFVAGLPWLAGIALGYGLRERQRRRHTQRLLHLQSEEIIYSNNELEKKFRDLDAKIAQLSASYQTIEDLTRGLEDKVRVRTEQLRVANEDLKTAYRDLQATQMQLIQREKMASVGQLVAGVAHELNNPIGFVFSNVTTLEDFVRRLRTMLETYRAVDLPPAAREQVDAQWQGLKVDYALKYLDSMTQGIREGAERARKIVRDLRVFARSDEDVWQPVDLHGELESSLTLLNHMLKDRVEVDRRYGTLPSVECVRSQIDQVFLNLLANAAQAITGNGTITIETRTDGDMAVVSIADTGSGIAPDIAGKIFDPFFTTKPVGEGTGLGLSISYELIKKHQGEITAAGRPGGGAVFTVRLPVARAGRPA